MKRHAPYFAFACLSLAFTGQVHATEKDEPAQPAITAPNKAKAAQDAARGKHSSSEELDAATTKQDEDGPYTLLNPTPDDKLRPMSTERPSRTDSALTVDPGRVQVEVNLLGYGYDRDTSGQDTKLNQLYLGGSTNIRVGLTENSDVQFLFDAFRDLNVRDFAAGTRDERSGFGDLNLRYKYSFWGNHGEQTALAIVPFIKLPTNSDNLGNDAYEGGVELPFAVTLKDGYSLGGQTIISLLERCR